MQATRKRVKKPDWQQNIAEERIEILFNLAEKEFRGNPSHTRRYIQLARKIGQRYNVRMRSGQKGKFCRKCNYLLLPGATSTVRLDSKRKILIIKCKNCNTIYRHPYKNA